MKEVAVTTFELHLAPLGAANAELPWHEEPPAARGDAMRILESDGVVWVRVDAPQRRLVRVAESCEAVAGFRVARRKLGAELGMLAPRADVRVNGLPALRFTMLAPKDSVLLESGYLTYVTERFRPYVGTPPRECIGKKCSFCRIPATESTRIVTCRCGVFYHSESVESHPDVPDDDRLKCLDRIKKCLSCGRTVSLDEYLVWDPQSEW
jgi:hypothetical protein